jgi:hypothetical protein
MSMRKSFAAPPPKADRRAFGTSMGARNTDELSFEERARLSANGAHGRRPASASFGGRSHRTAADDDEDEEDFDEDDEDDREGSDDDDEDEGDSDDDDDDDEDGGAGAGRAQRAKAPGALKKRTNKNRYDYFFCAYQINTATRRWILQVNRHSSEYPLLVCP